MAEHNEHSIVATTKLTHLLKLHGTPSRRLAECLLGVTGLEERACMGGDRVDMVKKAVK